MSSIASVHVNLLEDTAKRFGASEEPGAPAMSP
jgi:hypothetical protein